MNIFNETKEFKSADGKLVPYLQYMPEKEVNVSIVILYEIFGLTNHIKKVASLYANEGYLVTIPDIFSRLEKNINLPYNSEGFKKGIRLKESIGWEIPVMDTVALAALLKQKYKTIVLGYCFGGSLAWLCMQKTFIFDKGICYYGSSISEFLKSNINCPAMLHFGKDDKGIPDKEIKKIQGYATTQKMNIKINEYEKADHGFNCEDRISFNPKAAKLAQDRSINFIKEV